jgi:hypothetical protein
VGSYVIKENASLPVEVLDNDNPLHICHKKKTEGAAII